MTYLRNLSTRFVSRLAVLIAAMSVVTVAQAQQAIDTAGPDESVVLPGAQLKKLEGSYSFTEGPSVDAEGNVYFTDQPNNRIVKWSAADGTVEDWLKPAGRANGTWIDKQGNLIACADNKNQLWKIAPDKTVEVLLQDYDGKLLNGPNDVWVRPDGGLYFTDPLYRREYWKRDPASQQDGHHVYFLGKGAKSAIRVADDLRQPNGIIGTPDGKKLYVADIRADKTYVYDVNTNGTLSNKRLFCELGSDGMTIDNQGNIYLTGRGVTVFDPSGMKIAHIPVPEGWTANATFGGQQRDLLFITASKGIYGVKMRVRGAAAP